MFIPTFLSVAMDPKPYHRHFNRNSVKNEPSGAMDAYAEPWWHSFVLQVQGAGSYRVGSHELYLQYRHQILDARLLHAQRITGPGI